MLRIPYFPASIGFASTSTFATLSLPAYSPAISSREGAIILHGPHHSAQKSTSTGTVEFNTSVSKFWSVAASAFPTDSSQGRRSDGGRRSCFRTVRRARGALRCAHVSRLDGAPGAVKAREGGKSLPKHQLNVNSTTITSFDRFRRACHLPSAERFPSRTHRPGGLRRPPPGRRSPRLARRAGPPRRHR